MSPGNVRYRLRPMPDFLKKLLAREGLWVVVAAALVYFPTLGASGLWDPWETHYAEVARRILQDGDWITLRWQNEYFFSKPVLIFWLEALSFSVFGLTAWAARLPHVLTGIFGVWLAWYTLDRLAGRRAARWGALVLASAPFYLFISRQAITDITFCVFVSGALCCYLLVRELEKPPVAARIGLWLMAGLAALAKSPLALGIPALVVLVDLLLSGRWRDLRRLDWWWGVPLFLAVAAPWYVAVTVKNWPAFFNEFFLHHNLQRAFTGVHGERGGLEYFIKQLAYGTFPWVGLAPLVFGTTARRLGRSLSRVYSDRSDAKGRLEVFTLLWLGINFLVFSLMITKFHHYVFPAVFPLALLWGIELADEETTGSELLAPLSVLTLILVANDVVSSPSGISNLCTYAYERPLPEKDYPRWLLLAISALMGAGLLARRWWRGAEKLFWLPGLLTALLLSWQYQPALGRALSQEEIFRTIERLSKPGDRIYQYQMNWRGEVFYSRDKIVKLSSEQAVEDALRQPGRVFIVSVADAFSAINLAARRATGKHLYQLRGSNIRYSLASNVLDPGEEDLNPITKNLFNRENPPAISHPLRAEFADGVAFLGYDIEPAEPRTGGEFELTLYFECLARVSKPWRVFVHVDGFGHEFYRINGDHEPLGGLYPTDRWLAGDIVRDKVKLRVPFEYRPGEFTLYLGFYSGEPRMAVLPGFPQDGANRVRAGVINIR